MPLRDIKILFNEVKDKHAQENWYKLKLYLERLNTNFSATINQTFTTINEGLWNKKTTAVGASTTGELLDSIVLANMCSVTYIVCVHNALGAKKMVLNLQAMKDDNGVIDQVYGKKGTFMNVAFHSVINGSYYELRCDNNELFAVTITISKLVNN